MDRQIKFRGLRVDGKGWVYGFYVFTSNKYHQILTGKWDRKCGCHYSYEVIPSSVGQFTGLLDQNGKEIYEHDILHCPGYSCEVTFLNGSFRAIYRHLEDGEILILGEELDNTCMQVISNIHEESAVSN